MGRRILPASIPNVLWNVHMACTFHPPPALSCLILAIVAGAASCKTNDAAQPPQGVAASETVETAPARAGGTAGSGSPSNGPASIHALVMNRLDGAETPLSAWAGQVLLIVNTASKCGYTPQYQGLQQLHAKYASRGFAVLGFPSNDFGGQEPGTSEEIAKFCISVYDVNFPMFEKTKTTGQERSPLYAILSEARGAPKWNFHKYLIDKRGNPVAAWGSAMDPGAPEIAAAIEAQLAAN